MDYVARISSPFERADSLDAARVRARVTPDGIDRDCLGHDQSKSADCKRPKPLLAPCIDHTVDYRVLAHRRNPQTVLELDTTNRGRTEEERYRGNTT